MKLLIVFLVLLLSCSKDLPTIQYGDCVLIKETHFFGGKVFKLVDTSFDSYMGIMIDDRLNVEHFEVDEIEQVVNCPISL